jgi:transposase
MLFHFQFKYDIIVTNPQGGVAMARKARGRDLLDQARGYLSKAKTAEELRQVQAFVMPLEFGLSMEQTARAIGVSTGWACQLRNRFIKEGVIPRQDKPLRGGRRRANMSLEEEKAFLEPFFDKAKEGGILVVSEIKDALDQRLGRNVALASAYNLLHRHDWRKLAPDKRHPQSDRNAQEEWGKNSPTLLPKPGKPGRVKGRSV